VVNRLVDACLSWRASACVSLETSAGVIEGTASGVPDEPTDRIPYEWLPVALLATVVLGCHVGL